MTARMTDVCCSLLEALVTAIFMGIVFLTIISFR
jgi:hypothetical protein